MTPTLQTPRLDIRPPTAADEPAMLAFFASERSRFYRGPLDAAAAWRVFATYAGQWMLRGYGFFALVDRSSGATVGLAGPFHPVEFPEPEMSWLLVDAAHEGQGLAQEGCAAVLAHLFDDLGWANVVSYIDPANHASRALAERLGARPDPDAVVPLPVCAAFRHWPGGRAP